MNPCSLTITTLRAHRTRPAQPVHVAPSPYAPWEFWAHVGVLVLVPIALSFSPYARTGHAKPASPATSTIDHASHDQTVPSACIDGARCEGAER